MTVGSHWLGGKEKFEGKRKEAEGITPCQDELNPGAFAQHRGRGDLDVLQEDFGWFGGAWCPWDAISRGAHAPAPGPVLRGRRELPDLMLCARESGERAKRSPSNMSERKCVST